MAFGAGVRFEWYYNLKGLPSRCVSYFDGSERLPCPVPFRRILVPSQGEIEQLKVEASALKPYKMSVDRFNAKTQVKIFKRDVIQLFYILKPLILMT